MDQDSIAIPTIYISPCSSEYNLAATQSQIILLRAKEIAKEIIHRAIDINSGLTPQGTISQES